MTRERTLWGLTERARWPLPVAITAIFALAAVGEARGSTACGLTQVLPISLVFVVVMALLCSAIGRAQVRDAHLFWSPGTPAGIGSWGTRGRLERVEAVAGAAGLDSRR